MTVAYALPALTYGICCPGEMCAWLQLWVVCVSDQPKVIFILCFLRRSILCLKSTAPHLWKYEADHPSLRTVTPRFFPSPGPQSLLLPLLSHPSLSLYGVIPKQTSNFALPTFFSCFSPTFLLPVRTNWWSCPHSHISLVFNSLLPVVHPYNSPENVLEDTEDQYIVKSWWTDTWPPGSTPQHPLWLNISLNITFFSWLLWHLCLVFFPPY